MADAVKRIAVIIRERQIEGLRMAVGLTVLGDTVDVFILDALVDEGPYIDMSLEALRQMDGSVYTNEQRNPFIFDTTEGIAERLTGYDTIVPY